jgi:hypothetical protein
MKKIAMMPLINFNFIANCLHFEWGLLEFLELWLVEREAI